MHVHARYTTGSSNAIKAAATTGFSVPKAFWMVLNDNMMKGDCSWIS